MIRTPVKEILVNSGELRFSSMPAMFVSSGIGSCVVLFIYDPKKKIGGVAHIMLPGDESNRLTTRKALFANTAPAFLASKLTEMGADPASLKAKIIGGGNMFDWAEAEGFRDLGRYNVEQVKRELLKERIYLAAEVSGGSRKTVRCCTLTGNVYVRKDQAREMII